MICPRCSSRIAPDDRFCRKCGHLLTRQPAQRHSRKPLLARLSPNQLRVAGTALAGLLALIALLLIIFPSGEKRKPVPRPTNLGAELTARQPSRGRPGIATKAFYGKVTALQRGSITIQTIPEGKPYMVYVGRRTIFEPRRYPAIGERVKVVYIEDRGYLKATQVEIQP